MVAKKVKHSLLNTMFGSAFFSFLKTLLLKKINTIYSHQRFSYCNSSQILPTLPPTKFCTISFSLSSENKQNGQTKKRKKTSVRNTHIFTIKTIKTWKHNILAKTSVIQNAQANQYYLKCMQNYHWVCFVLAMYRWAWVCTVEHGSALQCD